MDDKVDGLIANVKKWKDAEQVAVEKAKKAEECVLNAKETKKKAEDELASARLNHSRYLQ